MRNQSRASAPTRLFSYFSFQLILMGSLAGSDCRIAHAGDLNPPFALETAETLPKNIRNPRFINIFANVTTKFNGDGSTVGLGDPLNKAVHWSDVLYETTKLEGKAKADQISGILKRYGIDENGAPGFTQGEVNTYANVKVAALAWGLTDDFTVAGVLPIVHVEVSASTGFATPVGAEDYQKFVAALSQAQSPQIAQEATSQFNDAVNRKLVRLGYDPIPSSETINGVGDAQLIGKYRVLNDGVNGIALKGSLIFPTGTGPNPDKALDVPTGNGRFGAGLAAIYDRRLPFDLRWNNYASYTAWLPHHMNKRIPLTVDDSLSADKEELYEHARHQFALGTGLDHYFPSTGIVVGAGYSFEYLTRVNFESGDQKLGDDRYYLLGDLQPVEQLHSVLVSLAFSTIDWYKNKKFFYPFQVGLSYSHPFAGLNAPSGDLVAGELVVFF